MGWRQGRKEGREGKREGGKKSYQQNQILANFQRYICTGELGVKDSIDK